MDTTANGRWISPEAAERIHHMRARLLAMTGRGEAPRGGHRGGRHGGPFGPGGFSPFGRGPMGFGGGPPLGRFGRGGFGPRMKRGDVRAAILALLAEQPRNGYQMIQEIEQRSQGLWRPSAGSVYPALQQLEDEGLVVAAESAGKREFSLTAAGNAYVKEHPDEIAAPFASVADSVDGGTVSLFEVAAQVGAAVFQVGQAGTPDQVAQARDLLAQTRRSLYTILAADDAGAGDQAGPA